MYKKISHYILVVLTLVSISCVSSEQEKQWEKERKEKEARTNLLLKFHEGDVVVMKADGGRAVVIDKTWDRWGNGKWLYEVRFAVEKIYTDTKIFSKDGAIYAQRYDTLWVAEHEIYGFPKQKIMDRCENGE